MFVIKYNRKNYGYLYFFRGRYGKYNLFEF